MSRQELMSRWGEAAQSGSLLTPKHDPANVGVQMATYRSVLTPQMSASLEQFISSGDYTIRHYEDRLYPNGAGYYEVVPSAQSGFSVVGSGIPSGSITPSGSLDSLIFVSGSAQGWHVYAESQTNISGSVGSGRLTLKADL